VERTIASSSRSSNRAPSAGNLSATNKGTTNHEGADSRVLPAASLARAGGDQATTVRDLLRRSSPRASYNLFNDDVLHFDAFADTNGTVHSHGTSEVRFQFEKCLSKLSVTLSNDNPTLNLKLR
jgi:hypothetical protein